MAYTAFSIAMVALTAFTFLYPASRLVAQLIVIAVVSTLLFLTEGLTSPFFSFFTFILLATALRWRSRGLVATAAVLAVVLLVASVVQAHLQPSLDPDNYEFNRVFIRGAYLVV